MPERWSARTRGVMWGEHAVRLRVSHLLSMARLEPSGQPESAIVIVRRLADPLPGKLASSPDAVVPSLDWERAVQAAVGGCFARAARPADGPVAPGAIAVCFRDEAELLACLAEDFLVGELSGRWWWEAWLRATRISTLHLVLDAWLKDARHVPAAMAILQRRDRLSRFVRALSPREARPLLAAMTEAFDLPAVTADAPIGNIAEPSLGPTPVARLSVGAPREAPHRAAIPEAIVSEPPWASFNPPVNVPVSLDVEQRTLMGVGLSLWHAPLAVRTREFQHALHVWRRRAEVESPRLPEPRVESVRARSSDNEVPEAAASARNAPGGSSVAEPALEPSPNVADAPDVPPARGAALAGAEPVQPNSDAEEMAPSLEKAVPSESVHPDPIERASDTAAVADLRPSFVETRSRRPQIDSPAPNGTIARAPEAAPQAGATSGPLVDAHVGPRLQVDTVTTGLGGVLFLVNVLEALRFFDRLDDHFHITSTIGAWSWLEIIGRSLLGQRQAEAEADPLWGALGDLDGRPRGAAFRAPRNLHLPETWPAPTRLPRPHRRTPAGDLPHDLRRFLDLLTPYLRWRLLQALDFHSGSPRKENALLASRVLCRRGRLEWTATHVDLHMDMSQIDIAVRLAGLDANPGWVPAFGRVVTFHFD